MKIVIDGDCFDSLNKQFCISLSKKEINWFIKFLDEYKEKVKDDEEMAFIFDNKLGRIPSVLL